ncbi:MAG: lipoprotein-releasing ABC transporter ATP-binding protein LolD [Gammaproteobacteria bacterium]|nr:lipoprotein-releasing ABC transporter ATP-binding protein LolD [Gammaproteobacteria bacterium]
MSNVVLAANGLNKSYDDAGEKLVVLDSLELTVQAGETLAIVGASGSGKSTLLQLLAGLDTADSGDVSVAGIDIRGLSPAKLGRLRNQHMGFVYQFHHLLPEFDALENVAMPLLLAGKSTKEASERAATMLDRVGLVKRLKHRPSELSGGERQRAAVARALVSEPAVVLADEPTGNLDQENAMQVFELMLELNQQTNTAIVLVTHDEHLAAKMPRQELLQNGKLVTL